MDRVCAVIVTYNRKELLRECLQAVLSQTRPPDHVLVVDNASTDGTREMLKEEFPQVEVLALPENRGGAGGYKAGLIQAHRQGFDWYWLMDDDTLPFPEALQELFKAKEAFEEIKGYPPLYLGSGAYWKDGRPHLMNWPGFTKGEKDFFKLGQRGVLPASHLSFVSLLLSRQAVDRYGLPLEDFFLWGDDAEYIGRIAYSSGEALGGFVITSLVLHASRENARPFEVGRERIPLFFYETRNRIWLAKMLPDGQARLYHLAALGLNAFRFLLRQRLSLAALKAVLSGLVAGIFTRPRK